MEGLVEVLFTALVVVGLGVLGIVLLVLADAWNRTRARRRPPPPEEGDERRGRA